MSSWKSFEEIEAWQLARDFCNDVFKLMTETELKNDFRLKDQINGSSGSVMDNIAEGFDRDGNKEFVNFLSIAKGSAGESRSQLYRIFDRGYIDEEKFNNLRKTAIEITNKIGALMTYLKKSGYKGVKFKKL